MSGLSKFLAGVGWGGGAGVMNACVQLAFMAVMARLLEPVDFGLVAIATVMLRFLTYFSQMSVGPALIQKPSLSDGDVRAALTVSLAISVLCMVLADLIAPLVGRFFGFDRLSSLIRALAVNFVINGFSVVPLSLLRREMRFRQIAIVETSAYLFGCSVGIALAFSGFGVWALVGAVLCQSAMTAVLASLISAWRALGLRHGWEERAYFLSFGVRYSIISFTEFLSGSLDALIVAKLFGASAAGIYGRAAQLVSLPVQQPSNILTRALFPVMSRLSQERQLAGFQASALLVGSFAFATSMGIVAAADDLVRVLLGTKWLDAVPIVQALGFAVAPQYLSHLAGVTLDARAELRVKLRIQILVLLFQCGAFVVLLPLGALGIAAAVVVAEWLRLVVMGIAISRLLRPTVRQLGEVLRIAVTGASFSFSLVWISGHLLPAELPPMIRLLVEIAAGAGALGGAVWVNREGVGRATVIAELAERVPILKRLIRI